MQGMNRARIDTLSEQQRRRRVPQVVVANGRKVGVSKDRLEQPVEVALVERRADGRRENQPGLAPPCPGGQPLLKLTQSMRAQSVGHQAGDRDGATTAIRLGFRKPHGGSHRLQLLPHLRELAREPAPLGAVFRCVQFR